MLTFGELFAGIGGFSLGLERAGMTCKWQVEIDPYAQAVLRKHWPDVPKHDDVRTFPPQGDWAVDLLCGGFPCQDISVAGKGAGLAGSRSGLWHEFARIIRVLRPRWVVVENVPALTARGLGTVLGDLAQIGFDAEWHCIPASAVGAPHRRDRIWIVAHANDQGQSDVPVDDVSRRGLSELAGGHVADAASERQQGDWTARYQESRKPFGARVSSDGCGYGVNGWWATEPDVGRVAHGIPSRVDRLRCLGNAVVPQVVEIIGRAIIETEERLSTGAAVESLHGKDATHSRRA